METKGKPSNQSLDEAKDFLADLEPKSNLFFNAKMTLAQVLGEPVTADKFGGELFKRAKSGFYTGVVELTSGFIAVDKNGLDVITGMTS